jgi:hypothetical protein
MKIIYKIFAYVKNYAYLCHVKNKDIKVLIITNNTPIFKQL